MIRRSHVILCALAALAAGCNAGGGKGGGRALSCVAPERPPEGTLVALEPAFEPLTFRRAVGLYRHPSNADRWYVMEQRGTIQTFLASDPQGTLTEFLNLQAEVDDGSNEAGLLGFAFHPDFDLNGRIFVSYTRDGVGAFPFESVISELTATVDGLTAMGPESVILTVDQPYANHNGGDIKFGHDGLLYLSFGDGGSAGDPLDSGQDVGSLLGKMLRIDVDAGTPYAIPPDNPFAAGGGAPEIFAWGLRNLWRFSFDRDTGALWGGDVGQNSREEIDVVELGGNYGWNEKEGTRCYDAPSPCEEPQWIDPVLDYPRSDGQSVTGGYVYRGTAIDALAGAYVYGDFETGAIWALQEGASVPELLASSGLSISAFGEGADGELYVVHHANSSSVVYRIVASEEPGAGTLPLLLTDTGCVDPDDPRRPVRSLIPYDVNVELWSDGAAKRRWLSLPDGERIEIEDDGDWTLPRGTVLVKEFAREGRLLETRLFVRHEDGGWAGYTYEWDAAQQNATLLLGGKTEDVAGGPWMYPSGTECLECHREAAGDSLGLETAQLNRDFPEGSGRSGNQIEWLRDEGLFEQDPGDAAALPAFPRLDDAAASLESRARAYLHANCSNCHRPGGTTQSDMDLRADTALGAMNVCDVVPTQGDFGDPDARLLVPGAPKDSLLVVRMHLLGEGRMPDLASSAVDREGADVVARWIAELESCP